MQKLNNLPQIVLENISDDVTQALETVTFKTVKEAPWALRMFSSAFNEPYFAYKTIIYVPDGHVAMAQSKEPEQRIIATSKLLPWVYAIKNNSVNTMLDFFYTMTNVTVRSYYFLYEYALLKSHDLPETPELIATGFISTRRNIFTFRRNPDKVLEVLKNLLNSKIVRTSEN